MWLSFSSEPTGTGDTCGLVQAKTLRLVTCTKSSRWDQSPGCGHFQQGSGDEINLIRLCLLFECHLTRDSGGNNQPHVLVCSIIKKPS